MLRQGYATVSAAILCLMLAACGGGGGGASAGSPSTSNVASALGTSTSPGTTGSASIAFSIAIPQTALQGNARNVQYISAATHSASIAILNNGNPVGPATIVNCATTCATTMNAPAGKDTFNITLFDQNGGQGNTLSQGTTVATIVAGQSNNVSVAFGGAVSKVAFSTPTASFTQGAPASVPLTVTAYDASGNAIVGAQNYLTPIALTNSDSSGATTLSTSTLVTPGQPVTVNYTGAPLANASIGASVNGQSVTATTVALSAMPSAPVGSVRSHMKIYAVLPGNFHNQQGVDSVAQVQNNYATIAKYVDFMETDNRASTYAHEAGIKVGFYTDPVQAHGNELSWSDAAFAHDCAGNIVIPNYPETERLGDVNSPTLVASWNAEIQSHLHDQYGSYPQDFVRIDDTGYPGEQWQGFFAKNYGGVREPAGRPYCNYTDSSYLSGLHNLMASAPVPVLFNGATDPLYTSYTSGQSNVLGGQCETCFGGWTGSTWKAHVNTEISFVGQQKVFNSYSHGNSTPDQMMYLYASMLLGYDPNYTVLSMDIATPSHISTTPLAMLVPMSPTVTASTVDGYRSPEGDYVRQFGACYISQVASGPCAVVVNSDTSAHAFPASLAGYHHTATISGSGIAHEFGDTGAVTATGSAPPSQMGSMSATIVFN